MADYKFLTKPSLTEEAHTSDKGMGKTRFLSDKIIELLNFRINQEEESSRIYLAASLALEDKAYFNAAKLYRKYSNEELVHAEKSREYLLSFNIRPETRPIKEVKNNYEGLVDIIYASVDHEYLVTQQCKELAKAALDEGDLLTFNLAQFYLAEQIEESAKVNDLQNHLETFGTDKVALKLLDNYIEELL